jgi:hypothetical protein
VQESRLISAVLIALDEPIGERSLFIYACPAERSTKQESTALSIPIKSIIQASGANIEKPHSHSVGLPRKGLPTERRAAVADGE